MPYNYHQFVYYLCEAYFPDMDLGGGGICFGLNAAYLNAYFTGDEETFFKRKQFIESYEGRPTQLIDEIHEAADKVRQGMAVERLSIKDQELLNIKAFMEVIVSNHLPHKLQDFFPKTATQSYVDSHLASKPSSMIKEPTIISTQTFSMTQAEIEDYLDKLEPIMKSSKAPIAIEIRTDFHVMTLTYNHEASKWSYVDSNAGKQRAEYIHLKKLAAHNLIAESSFSLSGIMLESDRVKQMSAFSFSFIALEENCHLKQALDTLHQPYKEALDPNKKNDRGVNPLYMAAQCGDLATITHLIEKGGDLNQENGTLGSALHIASQNGHLDSVKKLLSSGADVNCIHPINHITPLSVAAYVGHSNVVKTLLKAGADLSTGDKNPLKLALKNGHVDCVKAFIEHGIDIHPMLVNAVREDEEKALRCLIEVLPHHLDLAALYERTDHRDIKRLALETLFEAFPDSDTILSPRGTVANYEKKKGEMKSYYDIILSLDTYPDEKIDAFWKLAELAATPRSNVVSDFFGKSKYGETHSIKKLFKAVSTNAPLVAFLLNDSDNKEQKLIEKELKQQLLINHSAQLNGSVRFR